jgi:glycosyltransferase 2 family protein
MTRAGALRLLIAVVLTAWVVWAANPSQVMAETADADWRWITAAVALVLADRALMAYRWMVLLRALTPGTRPPLAAVLRIFFASTFVGSFLPSLAGDVYRAYSLSRLHVSGVESAASVLMDRALGILSMVVVAVVALSFAPNVRGMPGVLPTVLIATAGCVVAAAGIYSEHVAAFATSMASVLPGRRARALSVGLVDAVRRYARHHGELTAVLVASIGVQVLRVVQAYCLGRALGLSVPASVYFVFVPLVVIVMQIPVTTMGLGTGQLAFDVFFGAVGVPSADAVALSILFVALAIVGNLPGGLVYLTGRQPSYLQLK